MGHAKQYAGNIIQVVYEEYTGQKFPESPPSNGNTGPMRRPNTAAATTATNSDYYPQAPAPFVPARHRSNGDAAGPSPAGPYRNTAQRLHRAAPAANRASASANIGQNIVCPCGGQVFSDPKELVVCQTCKKAGRHKLQHASHMGYTVGSITAADREKYMCDRCRVTYADPFWRDSTAAGVKDAWLLPFTFVPGHRVRQSVLTPICASIQSSHHRSVLFLMLVRYQLCAGKGNSPRGVHTSSPLCMYAVQHPFS